MTPQEIENFYEKLRKICDRLKIDLQNVNQKKIRKGEQGTRVSLLIDSDGYARFNVICYDKKGYTDIANQCYIEGKWIKHELSKDKDWEEASKK